jgi:hypothetical protein
MWLMAGGLESRIQVIVQCVRVMRVFRVFRIIRVVRSLSLASSFAFQRQVFVLVVTVLSLIFAAAGMFQILESTPDVEYPFHKAVYFAAITVIGRPGVPFAAAATALFLTVLGATAATVIPTFVAELIRLWFDSSALETYVGNPETPHVVLCGDTNVSRLRALVDGMGRVCFGPRLGADSKGLPGGLQLGPYAQPFVFNWSATPLDVATRMTAAALAPAARALPDAAWNASAPQPATSRAAQGSSQGARKAA